MKKNYKIICLSSIILLLISTILPFIVIDGDIAKEYRNFFTRQASIYFLLFVIISLILILFNKFKLLFIPALISFGIVIYTMITFNHMSFGNYSGISFSFGCYISLIFSLLLSIISIINWFKPKKDI